MVKSSFDVGESLQLGQATLVIVDRRTRFLNPLSAASAASELSRTGANPSHR
jgi:hypothetical protein